MHQARCRFAMALIKKLYDIEKQCKDFDAQQRQAFRTLHCTPILTELRDWVNKTLPKLVKESTLGKAVSYLHKQWDKLIRYVDDGNLCIDNNAIERTIRQFVIGRNAWIFSDTPSGAKASANIYSLVQTAKANGVEPYRYLRKILSELPNIDPSHHEPLDALLPWNVNPNTLVFPVYD